ncbi:hypothetical protein TNCV_3223601 [Trichonephila clavipes]|nr:hypothetical protein TNCV_3223601 [Trichonephila clavipes]
MYYQLLLPCPSRREKRKDVRALDPGCTSRCTPVVSHSLEHHTDDSAIFLARFHPNLEGCGTLVVKVTDSWPACHEFEPSTVEDPPCRGAMPVISVEISNVLPLVWCGN